MKNLKSLLKKSKIIEEQGSSRLFYRLKWNNKNCILMHSKPEDKEFKRYIDIANFLFNYKCVPKIYQYNEQEKILLMQDLGTQSLKEFLKECKNIEKTSIYNSCIDLLIKLQVKTQSISRKNAPYLDRAFNYEHLRWESTYFKTNFLQKICGFDKKNLDSLDKEFDELAKKTSSIKRTFVHRDFQSENIMICKGKPRIIDFQGARLGPYTYDLASLLKDPYINLSNKFIKKQLKYTFTTIKKNNYKIKEESFLKDFYLAAIQRNMQALGAYSFLSQTKKKLKFIKYIPPGVKQLKNAIIEMQNYIPKMCERTLSILNK